MTTSLTKQFFGHTVYRLRVWAQDPDSGRYASQSSAGPVTKEVGKFLLQVVHRDNRLTAQERRQVEIIADNLLTRELARYEAERNEREDYERELAENE